MSNWLDSTFWLNLLVQIGQDILKIIAIIIVYLIVRAIGKKIIERSFSTAAKKQNISPGRAQTLEKLVVSVFSYFLIFVLAVMIFETFGIDTKSLIAGAGIIGLAIGFGAQGLVSDVVTGFFILLEKQMDAGDVVEAAGINGVVEEIGIRTTHLRGFDGVLNYIPNRQIGTVTNYTRGNMRALVDIGISYDDDIDKAIDVIKTAADQVAAANEEVIVEEPSVLGVQSLGASDVVIRVICHTVNGEQYGIQRQMLKAIKEALDENGIDIPFPHQVNIHKKED